MFRITEHTCGTRSPQSEFSDPFPRHPADRKHKPTPSKYQHETTTIQSASLHFREGNSDKEYHAAIEPKGEGYIVTFAYGRRGNTLTTGIKNDTPVPLETATKLFNKLVASKVAKGYHTVRLAEETKPYQQSGDEGRDSGIRCQLLNPVEKEDVSRLLTGRTHCLQEKHDGRRLMVRKQGDKSLASTAGDSSSPSRMRSAMRSNKSRSMSSSTAKRWATRSTPSTCWK